MTQSLGDLLAVHPFFTDLAEGDIDLIAGCGRNVVFEPGTLIFKAGDPADYFYVLRHGRVALEIFVPERGPLIIETIDDGDVLGWSWLFPPYRWSSDARAVETTRALALDGACLRQKCQEDSRLGYELMKRFAQIMMERLSATRMRLIDVYGHGRLS